MDAIDIQRKFAEDEKKEVLIFNPLSEDVSWKYDGVEQEPIPSKENVRLKPSMAQVAGTLLVDLYLNTKHKNYPREKAHQLVFSND